MRAKLKELNRAGGTEYTGKKQLSLGWRKDVLHTSSKIRGDLGMVYW